MVTGICWDRKHRVFPVRCPSQKMPADSLAFACGCLTFMKELAISAASLVLVDPQGEIVGPGQRQRLRDDNIKKEISDDQTHRCIKYNRRTGPFIFAPNPW